MVKEGTTEGTGGTQPNLPMGVYPLPFGKARARELAALVANLRANSAHAAATGGGGGKRIFQRLPRHLRRRAMSHNVHRVPPQFRRRAAAEMLHTAESAPGSAAATSVRKHRTTRHKVLRRRRRHDRRPRRLAARPGWLPLHVWHAKRFVMCRRWGRVLPARRVDKGVRASYRAAAYLATAADCCAWGAVLLAARSRAALAAVLHRHTAPAAHAESPLLPAHTRAGRAGVFVFHRAGCCPRGAVAPVHYVWQPGAATLLLLVHPAARAAVAAELRASAAAVGAGAVTVTPCSDALLHVRVVGPRTLPLLARVLRPAVGTSTGTDADAAAASLWTRVAPALPSPAVLPRGAALALNIALPECPPVGRTLRPPKAKARAAAPAAPAGTTTGTGESAAGVLATVAAEWDRVAARALAESPLWALLQRGEKSSEGDGEDSSDGTVPVVLLQVPGADAGPKRAFGAGVAVLAPRRAAKALWLALVYAGAHATGAGEAAAAALEAGRPAFPRDWPDTAAARALAAAERAEREARHRARPPAKRPNYARLGVASPFAAPWAALAGGADPYVCRTAADVRDALARGTPDALVCGTVRCVGRGVVAPLAALYADGDAESPVGFVTSGAFRYTSGRGGGIACCVLRRCYGAADADAVCAARPCTLRARNTGATLLREVQFVPLLGADSLWL